MSAVAVTDALAKHFRDNVASAKEAYSTGVTAGSVALPADIYDAPVVLCMWTGVSVTPGSFERTTWTVEAVAWFSGADPAAAYAAYVGFVDEVRESIRTNWTLDGACTQISDWSAGPPQDADVNGKPFVRLPFQFLILEAGAVTYTA